MIEYSNNSLSPIVLVEDDDNDVVLLNRAFSQALVKHPLLVAHNGEEAIGLLGSKCEAATVNGTWRPCLLITDLKMPRLNGFELLMWIQTQPQLRPIPKLIFSSSVLEEDQQKSLELGATAYFVKPNNYTGLVELVQKWRQLYLDKA